MRRRRRVQLARIVAHRHSCVAATAKVLPHKQQRRAMGTHATVRDAACAHQAAVELRVLHRTQQHALHRRQTERQLTIRTGRQHHALARHEQRHLHGSTLARWRANAHA
jgi:hypothetical protein